MTCKEKDRHLIHHFTPFKTAPCFGIRGCHDFCDQIIGRGPCGNLIGAFTGQFRNQIANTRGRTARCATVKPWHPTGQRDKGRNIQNGLRTLIGTKFLKHFGGNVMGDRNGKKRTENDICSRVTGQFLKLLYPLFYPIYGRISRGLHGWHDLSQTPAIKRGINDATLRAPLCAIC